MTSLENYEDKVRANQVRAMHALDSAIKTAHTEPFLFDYDLDTRWASVTAFTTYVYKGRRFRLSIVEEVDLCGV
jgi:hypothetical protein